MIRRTFDAVFLNRVANHPEVRPWLGLPEAGPLDFQPFLDDPSNIGIEADGGGWILASKGLGIYEIHSLFLPEGRGASFFRNAREMLRYVFTRTDCVEIWTQCPDDNLAARMAALKNGFREIARREGIWGEDKVGVSYQSLPIDQWIMRDAEALKAGRAFHDQLGEHLSHPEDEAHDRAVGAALLMARAHNITKGVNVFNRLAALLGYAPIQAIAADIVATADSIIEIGPESIRVLRPLGDDVIL